MNEIYIDYLNGPDIARLGFNEEDILTAVNDGLIAAGRGQTVIEPRVHLQPKPGRGANRGANQRGHFNVLRGHVVPMGYAGIKVVGDYVDNYKLGLPSEFGLLMLFDPDTGVPRAIVDATALTEMRTGALTALGARYLAPDKPKILGHIGARGTAYWNVRLLDYLFDFDEIRVHSRRPESRESFAAKLRVDLNKPVTVTDSWEACLDGADILVEASRLQTPEPLFESRWVRRGALVVPYGTISALPLDIVDVVDKWVMDDLGQLRAGEFGALRPHINAGLVSEESFHAEIGSIAAGFASGRESQDETILFWHRGLATSDIALGCAMLEKAKSLGLGQSLRYA